MIAHLLGCPACGLFGIRARRRNQRAEDAAHIRFFAQLAAEIRAERAAARRATVIALFAPAVFA